MFDVFEKLRETPKLSYEVGEYAYYEYNGAQCRSRVKKIKIRKGQRRYVLENGLVL